MKTPPQEPSPVPVTRKGLPELENKTRELIEEQSLSEKGAEYLKGILDDVTLEQGYKAYIMDKFFRHWAISERQENLASDI